MTDPIKEQPIGGGVSVFTTHVHTFGTDAVLLADFAAPRRNSRVAEFGTGCGIISLIWCRDSLASRIDALDIQQEACELVRMAADRFSLNDRLVVHHLDLIEVKGNLPIGTYDLVVMNPPYKSESDGLKCPDRRIAIARHEILCNIEDITKAAGELLNAGGRFCLCSRPSRLCDVMVSMRNHAIEPKRLRFVHQRAGADPNLFLLEGKKGGKSGLIIEKPLMIENAIGGFSEEVIEIYGEYYAQKEKRKE